MYVCKYIKMWVSTRHKFCESLIIICVTKHKCRYFFFYTFQDIFSKEFSYVIDDHSGLKYGIELSHIVYLISVHILVCMPTLTVI